ncbi:response regulator [Leifsonia poae]|uniref:DNA-binding response regulator n=1 Tax=Leifsonia poae TaxID=110933 RepID=A0A9W6M043_9MICO|nr:response regulator transcription factor [Leifsonia poae]GLJ76530.1 DNA-binding response regulator [Leifsonia poae]
MTASLIRVFLLDDHEVVRRGIAALLDAEPDIEVVGEASTAREARARIPATMPDVAVLDVRLPDGSGIDVCRDVRQSSPQVACLMLTAYDDEEALRSAVIAGAAGYVIKDIRASKLLEAVRAAAAGKQLIDPSVSSKMVAQLKRSQHDPTFDSLGLREHQILALIADGLTNRQIAERLGLAEKTVKNYVSSLLAKLGLEHRTQAAILHLEHKASPQTP